MKCKHCGEIDNDEKNILRIGIIVLLAPIGLFLLRKYIGLPELIISTLVFGGIGISLLIFCFCIEKNVCCDCSSAKDFVKRKIREKKKQNDKEKRREYFRNINGDDE